MGVVQLRLLQLVTRWRCYYDIRAGTNTTAHNKRRRMSGNIGWGGGHITLKLDSNLRAGESEVATKKYNLFKIYMDILVARFLPLGQPQRIDVAALQEVVHKDAILAEALDKEGVQLGVVDHLEVLARHQIVLGNIEVHQRGG